MLSSIQKYCDFAVNHRPMIIAITLLLALAFPAICVKAALPCDMAAAEDLCDSMPISGPEGIWSFPEDNVIVLIMPDDTSQGEFRISVVQSDDCRLVPGEVIGCLKPSADADKFTLSLFTSRKRGRLSAPADCAATLVEKEEAIYIEKRKIKLKFNPLGFLPYFWRSIRFSISDPVKQIPNGMVRIYPSYDGNGSSLRKPRYL
ncbi:MAG: hypothetical protein NC328_05230 [Muribaculum sp.]|nr:hypothetical protein [Muribaculum sp.]